MNYILIKFNSFSNITIVNKSFKFLDYPLVVSIRSDNIACRLTVKPPYKILSFHELLCSLSTMFLGLPVGINSWISGR